MSRSLWRSSSACASVGNEMTTRSGIARYSFGCGRSLSEIDVDKRLGLRIDKQDGRRAVGALGFHQPAVAHLPDLVCQRVALGRNQGAHLVEQVRIDLALLHGILRIQVLLPVAAWRPLLGERGCG